MPNGIKVFVQVTRNESSDKEKTNCMVATGGGIVQTIPLKSLFNQLLA
jgi:hypothetical protein